MYVYWVTYVLYAFNSICFFELYAFLGIRNLFTITALILCEKRIFFFSCLWFLLLHLCYNTHIVEH